MVRKKFVNPNQPSFDFIFETYEEQKIVEHNQIIAAIIDDITTAPVSELSEVETIAQAYQPIILDSNINDKDFLASSWLDDNITAIKIANNYAKTNVISDEEKQLLLRYHGWGGLSEVFDERKSTGQFTDARTELKTVMIQ